MGFTLHSCAHTHPSNPLPQPTLTILTDDAFWECSKMCEPNTVRMLTTNVCECYVGQPEPYSHEANQLDP